MAISVLEKLISLTSESPFKVMGINFWDVRWNMLLCSALLNTKGDFWDKEEEKKAPLSAYK